MESTFGQGAEGGEGESVVRYFGNDKRLDAHSVNLRF